MTRAAARVIADELETRGLAAPARVLLAAHQPIAPLIGSAATFIAPMLRALLGRRAEALVGLFERPEGVDDLIHRLDEGGAAEDRCRTSAS